jgi:DNA-binding NarL/FixJ family response regulator
MPGISPSQWGSGARVIGREFLGYIWFMSLFIPSHGQKELTRMDNPGFQLILSARQEEVLALVVLGKRNKEIAQQLVLSVRTVKWQITQLFLRFGASNRTELVAKARNVVQNRTPPVQKGN